MKNETTENNKPLIVLHETKHPHGGVHCYNPKFRDMTLSEIERQEQENLQSYASVGYNSFTFNRACGLISIQKIDKYNNIRDIINTDMYGLLD